MKKKIIIINIILLMILNIQVVYAFNIDDILSGANNFIKSGESLVNDIDTSLSATIRPMVLGGIAVGTVIAVCVGIVLAIKVMTDGANGKKELKEALTPYVVSVIVLFGCYALWGAFTNTFENVFELSDGGTHIPIEHDWSIDNITQPAGQGSTAGGNDIQSGLLSQIEVVNSSTRTYKAKEDDFLKHRMKTLIPSAFGVAITNNWTSSDGVYVMFQTSKPLSKN